MCALMWLGVDYSVPAVAVNVPTTGVFEAFLCSAANAVCGAPTVHFNDMYYLQALYLWYASGQQGHVTTRVWVIAWQAQQTSRTISMGLDCVCTAADGGFAAVCPRSIMCRQETFQRPTCVLCSCDMDVPPVESFPPVLHHQATNACCINEANVVQ